MQERLTGEYMLLTVSTEGGGLGKWVSESRLTITSRAEVATKVAIGFARNVIADGRARVDREGYLHEMIRKVTAAKVVRYRISYFPPNGLDLFAVTDSSLIDREGNDEPGPLLEVTDIGWDGTLYGRWEATGIEAIMTPTPVGKLVERDRGYFCAWRAK